jgi:hypothetical protein
MLYSGSLGALGTIITNEFTATTSSSSASFAGWGTAAASFLHPTISAFLTQTQTHCY